MPGPDFTQSFTIDPEEQSFLEKAGDVALGAGEILFQGVKDIPETLLGLGRGAQKGLLGGFDEEAIAGLGVPLAELRQLFGMDPDTPIGETFDRLREEAGRSFESIETKRPIATGIGEVGGFVAGPGKVASSLAKGAGALRAAGKAGVLEQAGANALVAGGLGSARDGDGLTEAAIGAAGAFAGPILKLAAKTGQALVRRTIQASGVAAGVAPAIAKLPKAFAKEIPGLAKISEGTDNAVLKFLTPKDGGNKAMNLFRQGLGGSYKAAGGASGIIVGNITGIPLGLASGTAIASRFAQVRAERLAKLVDNPAPIINLFKKVPIIGPTLEAAIKAGPEVYRGVILALSQDREFNATIEAALGKGSAIFSEEDQVNLPDFSKPFTVEKR